MSKKKTCMLISIHAVLIAGITAGYLCMYNKIKKPKLNINSLSSFDN